MDMDRNECGAGNRVCPVNADWSSTAGSGVMLITKAMVLYTEV